MDFVELHVEVALPSGRVAPVKSIVSIDSLEDGFVVLSFPMTEDEVTNEEARRGVRITETLYLVSVSLDDCMPIE